MTKNYLEKYKKYKTKYLNLKYSGWGINLFSKPSDDVNNDDENNDYDDDDIFKFPGQSTNTQKKTNSPKSINPYDKYNQYSKKPSDRKI